MVLTLCLRVLYDLQPTATFTLHNLNRLVLYNRGGECLQRGTDWVLI